MVLFIEKGILLVLIALTFYIFMFHMVESIQQSTDFKIME